VAGFAKVTGLRFFAISNETGILPSMKYLSSSLLNVEKRKCFLPKIISKNIQKGTFFLASIFFSKRSTHIFATDNSAHCKFKEI
jgi:hypothetical protein